MATHRHMRAKGFSWCLKQWERGREKAQSQQQHRTPRSAYGGTSEPCGPSLAQPGQLMIPINNPDPEISDRSYNQSEVSPGRISQHARGEAQLSANFAGSSLGCGISSLKSSPSSSGVNHIIDTFDNHR